MDTTTPIKHDPARFWLDAMNTADDVDNIARQWGDSAPHFLRSVASLIMQQAKTIEANQSKTVEVPK